MATTDRSESCEARIGDHLASRELSYRLLFTSDEPDVEDDPQFAADYIAHAVDELDYEPGDDARVVLDALSAHLSADGAGTTESEDEDAPPWLETVVKAEDADNIYNGDTLGAAIQMIVNDIALRTQDKRMDAISEGPLGVSVTVTMRIELSTGGPADYVTAELDPQSRQVSNVQYHFADWYDHAETTVDDDSALGQLAAYFGETAQVPGTGE